MHQIPNSDVWYLTLKLPSGARFSYQLSPNDPLTFTALAPHNERPPRKRIRSILVDTIVRPIQASSTVEV
jgi:hypothetical protein